MQTRFLLAVFSDATARESDLRGIDDRLQFARRDFSNRATLWTRHREQVCPIANGNGLALGMVVARRESTNRLHRTLAHDRAPASNTSLDDLLKETWGNYVAFETETSTNCATVLRSPMGTLAAYYVGTNWGWAFASDVDLLCDAGILAPSVDWDRLGEHLQTPVFQRNDTCLAGVRELMSGTAMTIDRAGRSILRSRWSYQDHVTPAAGAYADAADRLHDTIAFAVSGMTDNCGRMAVSVSGGLDSSIVAACAVNAGVPVELFTLAGDDPDADERGFSRPLARSWARTCTNFGSMRTTSTSCDRVRATFQGHWAMPTPRRLPQNARSCAIATVSMRSLPAWAETMCSAQTFPPCRSSTEFGAKGQDAAPGKH
jgi:asparagine synthase (glutamine-hydrolysing)